MAKPVSNKVRVRVKVGATIKLSRDASASGGEWIEVDPADLAVPSFRANVETQGDLDAAAAKAATPAKSADGDLFAQLRASAHDQNKVAKQNAAAVTDGMAKVLAESITAPIQ